MSRDESARTVKFVLLQALCGAVASIGGSIYFFTTMPPNPIILTRPKEVDVLTMWAHAIAHPGIYWLVLTVGILPGLLALALSWALVAQQLNPHLPELPFDTAPRPRMAWAAVLLFWWVTSGLSMFELVPIEMELLVVLGLGVAAGWFMITHSLKSSKPLQPRLTMLLRGTLAIGAVFFLADRIGAAEEGLAVAMFCGALGWLIISPNGMAGTFESWRKLQDLGNHNGLKTAGLGALYGALMWAGSRIQSEITGFSGVFGMLTGWHHQYGLASMLKDFFWGVPQNATVFVASASLAAACVDGRLDWRARMKRALPGLIAAGLIGTVGLIRYADAVLNHDWRVPNLAAAVKFPDLEPPAHTLLTLGFAGEPKLTVKIWPANTRTSTSGILGASEAPASEDNARALFQFVSGRGKVSRYRNAALETAESIDAILWEPDGLSQSMQALDLENDVSFIQNYRERLRLAHAAPITQENRSRLVNLSDPDHYSLRRGDALLLSRTWLRFGDLDRAKHWRDIAERSGASPDKLKEYSIPPEPPLTDGTITGSIKIHGVSAQAIKVGLFSIGNGKGAYPPPHDSWLLEWIVEANPAGDDGSFRFEHLSEGRYALSILAPADALPPDDKRVRVSRNPAIITLSRAKSRFDAGRILITR